MNKSVYRVDIDVDKLSKNQQIANLESYIEDEHLDEYDYIVFNLTRNDKIIGASLGVKKEDGEHFEFKHGPESKFAAIDLNVGKEKEKYMQELKDALEKAKKRDQETVYIRMFDNEGHFQGGQIRELNEDGMYELVSRQIEEYETGKDGSNLMRSSIDRDFSNLTIRELVHMVVEEAVAEVSRHPSYNLPEKDLTKKNETVKEDPAKKDAEKDKSKDYSWVKESRNHEITAEELEAVKKMNGYQFAEALSIDDNSKKPLTAFGYKATEAQKIEVYKALKPIKEAIGHDYKNENKNELSDKINKQDFNKFLRSAVRVENDVKEMRKIAKDMGFEMSSIEVEVKNEKTVEKDANKKEPAKKDTERVNDAAGKDVGEPEEMVQEPVNKDQHEAAESSKVDYDKINSIQMRRGEKLILDPNDELSYNESLETGHPLYELKRIAESKGLETGSGIYMTAVTDTNRLLGPEKTNKILTGYLEKADPIQLGKFVKAVEQSSRFLDGVSREDMADIKQEISCKLNAIADVNIPPEKMIEVFGQAKSEDIAVEQEVPEDKIDREDDITFVNEEVDMENMTAADSFENFMNSAHAQEEIDDEIVEDYEDEFDYEDR